jgi:hypothetical protein
MRLLKQILLIGITGIFFIIQLFVYKSALLFIGVIIVALLLLSLKKYTLKNVAAIASILIIYPALIYLYALFVPYMLTTTFASGGLLLLSFALLLLLFALVYLKILKNLWQWIDTDLQNTLIVVLAVLFIFAVLISIPEAACMETSIAEKGVSAEAIAACKSWGYYNPNYAYSKIGLLKEWILFKNFLAIYIPIFFTIIFLVRSHSSTKKATD